MSYPPTSLREVMHQLEREHVLDTIARPEGADTTTADPRAALRDFPSEGVATLPALLSPGRAAALVKVLDELAARGLPPVFAYALDAFWEPLARLVPVVEGLVGPCEVLADGWAWNIAPGSGKSGWAPHRGTYDPMRQPDGRPGLVNVWIALSDVTLDTACMHVVPLSKDAGYPHALARQPFDTSHAKAYPLPPGHALFWDACSLHWGGPMTPAATHARAAYSFTLQAKSVPRLEGFDAVDDIKNMSFIQRLDLIAGQIVRYGMLDEVAAPLLEWAELLTALRASRLAHGAKAG